MDRAGIVSRLEWILGPLKGWTVVRNPRLDLGYAGAVRCDLALVSGHQPGLGRVELAVTVGTPVQRDALLQACAVAEVPEVWFIDLELGWVEVYRAPDGAVYRLRTVAYPGGELELPGGSGRRVVPLPVDR